MHLLLQGCSNQGQLSTVRLVPAGGMNLGVQCNSAAETTLMVVRMLINAVQEALLCQLTIQAVHNII